MATVRDERAARPRRRTRRSACGLAGPVDDVADDASGEQPSRTSSRLACAWSMPSSRARSSTISMKPPETTRDGEAEPLEGAHQGPRAGRELHRGAHLVQHRHRQARRGRRPARAGSRRSRARRASPRSVTAATSAWRPACSASSSMTSSWMRVESTSITTRRRPRRARPPGRDGDVEPVDAGLQGELPAQPVDVGTGHVELDRRDRVAGQPADAVDVGAVRGDPGGDRGDAARAQGRAEDDHRGPAAALRRAVAGALLDLDLEVELCADREQDLAQA